MEFYNFECFFFKMRKVTVTKIICFGDICSSFCCSYLPSHAKSMSSDLFSLLLCNFIYLKVEYTFFHLQTYSKESLSTVLSVASYSDEAFKEADRIFKLWGDGFEVPQRVNIHFILKYFPVYMCSEDNMKYIILRNQYRLMA